MEEPVIQIGVAVERRSSPSPWVDHSWRIAGLLPDAPDLARGTVLRREDGAVTFYAGAAELEFHTTETGNYRDNLQSGDPQLWLMFEATDDEIGLSLLSVTADPAEGEALTGAGDLVVEAVQMPPNIAAQLSAFVEAHHVERGFIKRVREP
jgi:hypothetical protein